MKSIFRQSGLGSVFLICTVAAVQPHALASSVTEKIDERIEFNWSQNRVKFLGEREAPSSASTDMYKEADKAAWKDGVGYLQKKVVEIQADKLKVAPPALAGFKPTIKELTGTKSIRTVYYSRGRVQIYLDHSLADVLAPAFHISFKGTSAGAIEVAGLLIQLNQKTKPFAVYRVVDDQGALLFGPEDVAEDAFKRNLMGRWFKEPTTADELAEAVGEGFTKVSARIHKPGEIVIDQATWRANKEAIRVALRQAQVALVLP